MAVNKNFVVRNGLEVSENLIYADDQQRRIGVGIITARYDLDVIGGIGATTVTSEGSVVTGLSTSNNNKIDGYISVGGTTGTNGQYLISTGQGLQWFSLPAVREEYIFAAAEGQTTFSSGVSYTPGLVDVFVNGVKLLATNQGDTPKEFTADDGSSVVLTTPAVKDAIVEIIAYGTSSVGVGTTATGIAGLTIQEDSTQIGPTGTVKTLNFVGASVSTFNSLGLGVTISIGGAAAGTGLWELNSGVGIHTDNKVGITTDLPRVELEVGNIGAAGTAVIINGDLRVTGIVTIGVGGTTYGFDGISGIVSAHSYFGDGSNLTGLSSVSLATTSFGLLGSPSITVSDINSTSGIATINNVTIGSGNTDLIVNGDARITGILTIGTSSLTLDGSNNQIVVGTAVTLSETGDADFVGVVTSFGGFSGSLTGDVTGNVTGDLTGNIVSGIMTGTVVGLASTAAEIHVMSDNTSGTTMHPLFVSSAGIHTALVDNTFLYTPSTNTISAGVFDGTMDGASLTGTINNARLPSSISVASSITAANFFGDGTNLTGYTVPGINTEGSSGFNNVSITGVSTLGRLEVASGIVTATSGLVTYYGDTSRTVEGNWNVDAGVGNDYYSFTGVGFTDGITSRNATFYLKKGKRYEFENDIGAHPFYIKTFESLGITGTTGRYDNGVTNNGATSGIIAFDVPFNAPDKLSYQCSAHAAMGGTIFLTGGDASTLVDFDAGINVTGVSTFNSDLTCAGVTTVTSQSFFAKQLTLSGVSTFFGNIDADGDLDVDGHAELDQLNVTGVSTFAGITTVTSQSFFTKQMSVSGVSTFVGVTTFSADVSVGVDTSVGVILTSPNGTPYRLVVANDGTLSTAAV